MGVFVAVLVDCPDCGTEVQFQANSVSGTGRYRLSGNREIPDEVVEDVAGKSEHCSNCSNRVELELEFVPTLEVVS